MRLLLLPAVAAAVLAKGVVIGIAIGATAVCACARARKSRAAAAPDDTAEETAA